MTAASGKGPLPHTLRTLLICSGVALLASCGKEPYTAPAGSLDNRSVLTGSPYGVMPPLPAGKKAPYEGVQLQRFADKLMGGRIAEFVAYRRTFSVFRDEEAHRFFPAPGAGTNPGMCEVRPFDVVQDLAKGVPKVIQQGWSETLYGVTGSVSPFPGSWPTGYEGRLNAACASRRDVGWWFWAEDRKQAYLAAQLADQAVAYALHGSRLPFSLQCMPYPPDWQGPDPRCASDARKTLSSIDPRTIVEVRSCVDEKTPHCMEISLPKDPAGYNIDTDQWSLRISYQPQGRSLKISKIDLVDSVRIIE